MSYLPLCRLCLSDTDRLCAVDRKCLQDIFEKLTGKPFRTDSLRPMLACNICYMQLKISHHLYVKCEDSEEIFAQMLDVDYEPTPLADPAKFFGLKKSRVFHVDIAGTPATPVNKEIVVSEGLPEERHQIQGIGTPATPVNKEIVVSEGLPEERHQIQGSTAAKKPELQTSAQSDTKFKIKQCLRSTSKPVPDKLKPEPAKKDFSCQYNGPSEIRFHPGDKYYECDTCQHKFTRKNDLIAHIRKHTGEKPFKCPICQRCFSQRNGLVAHSRTHTGEKPFHCTICQREFRQKMQLERHVRAHTGVRPYSCAICEHTFGQKSALLIHVRRHTGVKPYACEVCHLKFAQRCDLQVHNRVHTGEKPYTCRFCQHCFRIKGNLTKHIRTQHRQHNTDNPG